jgi:sugar (pentulose or hexulose) kinase
LSKTAAVLVIDLGLTNCKVSVFDAAGQMLALESQRYPTYTPQAGWSEQRMEDWWTALHGTVHALHSRSALDAVDLQAIIVTAHMHALVALDRDLQPLLPCLTLFDQRAQAQAASLRSPDLFARTGARLEPYTPAAKIAWLKQQQPDLFRQVKYFVAPKDAIRIMLGGDPVTDPIDAAGTLLYNLGQRAWDRDLLEAIGVDPAQMPDISAPSAPAGRLSDSAATALGLTAGIRRR